MGKKILLVYAAGIVALDALAIFSAASSGTPSNHLAHAENAHLTHTNFTEMAFRAPWNVKYHADGETASEDEDLNGYIPYYRCDDCCASSPLGSRYSIDDKTKSVSVEDVTILPYTISDSSSVASGDQITTVNTGKFKYVDQNSTGADEKEGTGSKAIYVSDGDKTAVYFSRSGKTASDEKASEFRFTPASALTDVYSVTFSYRYNNFGTASSTSGGGQSEPATNWKAVCQFIDDTNTTNKYFGMAIDDRLINDDAWHTLTITYKELSGATSYIDDADCFSNFSGFAMKFADLRGYIMISGLSFDQSAGEGYEGGESLKVGSISRSSTDSAITDAKLSTAASIYTDEACTTAFDGDLATAKKVYVKLPLSFETITSGGRSDQDSALGRLTLNIDLNGKLASSAKVYAQLKGYTKGWFQHYMLGKFIDTTGTSKISNHSVSGTMDTAIDASSIYALVTLDFSNADATTLGHVTSAFNISVNWSAYGSNMTGFSDSIKPVAYIIGDKSGWNLSSSEIYQMTPNIFSEKKVNDENVVEWMYKDLTGFSELKVLHNNDGTWDKGVNSCSYNGVSGGSIGSGGNAVVNGKTCTVYYATGESTFSVV
jgi:hypothetical protein